MYILKRGLWLLFVGWIFEGKAKKPGDRLGD